jgi:hypothetical protein
LLTPPGKHDGHEGVTTGQDTAGRTTARARKSVCTGPEFNTLFADGVSVCGQSGIDAPTARELGSLPQGLLIDAYVLTE